MSENIRKGAELNEEQLDNVTGGATLTPIEIIRERD